MLSIIKREILINIFNEYYLVCIPNIIINFIHLIHWNTNIFETFDN